MSGTKVMHCGCRSEFQDIRYGKGKRVHNGDGMGRAGASWRCSVCNAVRFADRSFNLPTQKSAKTKHRMGGKKAGLKGRKSSGGGKKIYRVMVLYSF